jgi:cell division septation protein DedD
MQNRYIPKIFINIFTICILLFSVSVYAGNNWVSIGVIGNDLWFVDTNSIACKENSCRVWIKILSRTSAKRSPLESEGHVEYLVDYNCTWLEYRILETTKYDSNGHVTNSAFPTDQKKKYKIQESANKQLHDLVCQKITLQQEQFNTNKKYTEIAKEKEEKNTVQKVKPATGQGSAKQLPSRARVLPKKLAPPQSFTSSKPVFTVQVGAFENVYYAKSLKTLLKKKGYHASIIPAKKKGKLYRVCIEKFSDREKAKALCEKIKEIEDYQAFVTTW